MNFDHTRSVDKVDGFVRGHYGHGLEKARAVLEQMIPSYKTVRTENELCRIMNEEHSDKGHGYHTYTQYYATLFEGSAHRVKNVLEVGLGTNNPEVPSTMGVDGTPGASLRGWKRFFPSANVYGADVDKRILFEEPHIETFFVDQLDQSTIGDLAKSIPVDLDFIIDDGLHTYEANTNLLFGLYHKLKPGGVYIIEDIAIFDENMKKFDQWFSTLNLDVALIDLPSDTNQWDNALFCIWK